MKPTDDADISRASRTLEHWTCSSESNNRSCTQSQLTWPIVRDQVEQIITVNDEQIIAAMRLLWERAKLLIEPSSAVVLAAVLDERFRELADFENVGLILSGGNVNLDKLPW